MLEARGNLWELAVNSTIVLTTNGTVKKDGSCVMGRGIALEAKTNFPGIDYKLGSYISRFGNRCYNLERYSLDASRWYNVVTFPVKHNWWEEADINLIYLSALQLKSLADLWHWDRVWLPRPGCGNGKLAWETVRPILEMVLDNRFIVTTF